MTDTRTFAHPVFLMTACACRMVLLLIVIAAGGCEAPGADGRDPFAWLKSKSTQIETTTGSAAASGEAVNRLTGTENGLAIRKWIVEDDETRIGSVLMRYAIGGVVHDDADERLRRNGFRLVKVEAGALQELLRELGGATLDVTAWHGQVYDWRTIASHGIGRNGQPLAIDGHVRRFPAGEMRLVMRSWIIPMEDGPFVQFELVPQFHKPQRTDVNLLLGRSRPEPIESYPSMAVDQLLESGAAYLLTCAPPQSQWTTDESQGQSIAEPDIAPRRRGGVGTGPGDVVGPDVATPQTIGQWMLSSDIGRPSRIILVLLPRISDRLFPVGSAKTNPVPVDQDKDA